jgi:hypothetical protein
MLAAAGLEHPAQLEAKHLVRRMSATEIKLFSQMHVFLKPGELLTGEVNGQFYSRMWQLARADSFEPHSEVAALRLRPHFKSGSGTCHTLYFFGARRNA